MTREVIEQLLAAVAAGQTSIPQAVQRLRAMPFEEIEHATVDHHRALRCGHPEVIFCPGKSVADTVSIAKRLAAIGGPVLATRGSPEQIAAIRDSFPQSIVSGAAILIQPPAAVEPQPGKPALAVVSAGTADQPVADEALLTLRLLSAPAHRISDVGVAGLHRLLAQVTTLQSCCAIVVIAGMEGALPSVVGGLVGCPVFAVPSSVGYGVNLSGLTTMLAMMSSCASNVSVVNIDNGFGAAMSAGMVYHQVVGARSGHA